MEDKEFGNNWFKSLELVNNNKNKKEKDLSISKDIPADHHKNDTLCKKCTRRYHKQNKRIFLNCEIESDSEEIFEFTWSMITVLACC